MVMYIGDHIGAVSLFVEGVVRYSFMNKLARLLGKMMATRLRSLFIFSRRSSATSFKKGVIGRAFFSGIDFFDFSAVNEPKVSSHVVMSHLFEQTAIVSDL